LSAIREDRTPILLLMRYALATWEVRDRNLLLHVGRNPDNGVGAGRWRLP